MMYEIILASDHVAWMEFVYMLNNQFDISLNENSILSSRPGLRPYGYQTTQRLSCACDRAPTLLKAMGKEPCPSKIHFARCVTQVEGRPDKVT